MRSFAFILVAFIFFHKTARADTAQSRCSAKDLSSKFGAVHDQTNPQWCWAFVAADLISFALDRKGLDQISVHDLAANMFHMKDEDWTRVSRRVKDRGNAFNLEPLIQIAKDNAAEKFGVPVSERRGSVPEAIFAYNGRGGACTIRQYSTDEPSSIRVNESNEGFPLLETWPHSLGDLEQSHNSSAEIEPIKPTLINLPKCARPPEWFKNFENLRRKIVEDEASNEDAYISKRCSPRSPMPNVLPEIVNYEPGPHFPVTSQLSQALIRNQPTAILFNTRFLRDKEKGDAMMHWTIIEGQRWNEATKTCEFRIRDSTGADCSGYIPPYNQPDKCSLGNVWVDGSRLKETVSVTTTVSVE